MSGMTFVEQAQSHTPSKCGRSEHNLSDQEKSEGLPVPYMLKPKELWDGDIPKPLEQRDQ